MSKYKRDSRKWYHLRSDTLTAYRGNTNAVKAIQNMGAYTFSVVELGIFASVGLVAIPFSIISA